MLVLTTNHKVADIVYVVDDCVRRGTVRQVNFVEQNVVGTPFTLSYEILYDGFTFNTTVNSTVTYDSAGAGSPAVAGSPPSSGSPLNGSPVLPGVVITETTNGGEIYTVKSDAINAFGDTLA